MKPIGVLHFMFSLMKLFTLLGANMRMGKGLTLPTPKFLKGVA